MRRVFPAAVLPLAVLAVVSPGRSIAGPPEKVGARMTFDTVADGLRKYRQETEPAKRAALLERLAPTRDPRVAVALAEALVKHEAQQVRQASLNALLFYYDIVSELPVAEDYATRRALAWWKENESDLRRRAAHLPR